MFVWLSGEIRDRKHLGEGAGGEERSRIVCSSALFDRASTRYIFRVSPVYGVARGKTDAISDLRDVMTSHLSLETKPPLVQPPRNIRLQVAD